MATISISRGRLLLFAAEDGHDRRLRVASTSFFGSREATSSWHSPLKCPRISRISPNRKLHVVSFGTGSCRKVEGFGIGKRKLTMYRSDRPSTSVHVYNGGGGGGDPEREAVVQRLVLAGVLVALTYTGAWRIVFDVFTSLWILVTLLVLGVIGTLTAVTWWTKSQIVSSSCPECGTEFPFFNKGSEDGTVFQCLYCMSPLMVKDKKFVRAGPKFSSNGGGSAQGAGGGFSASSSSAQSQRGNNWKSDVGGTVVDIEAEVRDKD